MSTDLAARVLASMRCGVVTIDTAGAVSTINAPAAQKLGVDRAAAAGRPSREVFAHCPAIAHLLEGAALGRETLPDRAELEIPSPEGRPLLLGFSLSRLVDDDGAPAGGVLFFKDLALVEEEREREALRGRLVSLGQVAAGLAHELRNLLGGVRMFLGLARRRAEAQAREYLDRAEEELLRANRKLGETLDFVRPLRLETVRCDAAALARAAVEGTLARFPGAEVRVEWEETSGSLPLRADPTRLVDALMNLCANAVEAMGGAGRLRLRLAAEEGRGPVPSPLAAGVPGLRGFGEGLRRRVKIEISDEGPGMDDDVRQRIFQPFFTTKEAGSGLGVPTAQKIVDAHGGALDVRSRPGEGTTCVVLLPADEEE